MCQGEDRNMQTRSSRDKVLFPFYDNPDELALPTEREINKEQEINHNEKKTRLNAMEILQEKKPYNEKKSDFFTDHNRSELQLALEEYGEVDNRAYYLALRRKLEPRSKSPLKEIISKIRQRGKYINFTFKKYVEIKDKEEAIEKIFSALSANTPSKKRKLSFNKDKLPHSKRQKISISSQEENSLQLSNGAETVDSQTAVLEQDINIKIQFEDAILQQLADDERSVVQNSVFIPGLNDPQEEKPYDYLFYQMMGLFATKNLNESESSAANVISLPFSEKLSDLITEEIELLDGIAIQTSSFEDEDQPGETHFPLDDEKTHHQRYSPTNNILKVNSPILSKFIDQKLYNQEEAKFLDDDKLILELEIYNFFSLQISGSVNYLLRKGMLTELLSDKIKISGNCILIPFKNEYKSEADALCAFIKAISQCIKLPNKQEENTKKRKLDDHVKEPAAKRQKIPNNTDLQNKFSTQIHTLFHRNFALDEQDLQDLLDYPEKTIAYSPKR